MKKFIRKTIRFIFIGSIPFILLCIYYFFADPFKVLYTYADYSYPTVDFNRDVISTEIFLSKQSKHSYNSFVFGSSRTLGIAPKTWAQYLNSKDQIFMFDASEENLFGIYTKIKFLDSIKVPLDHVIIMICRDVTFSDLNHEANHLFIKHPVTANTNKLSFHYAFLKAFFTPNFLMSYFTYKVTNTYKPFMKNYIESRRFAFDTLSNQIYFVDHDKEIKSNPEKYYKDREKMFYERHEEAYDSTPKIKPKHIFMLGEIKRLLLKNNSEYRIVISPLYDQIKMNRKDLKILRSYFDPYLFDFSGKNTLTDPKKNYYEIEHFRTNVGDSLLKYIYTH